MALCLDLILWIGTVALHDEIFMEVSCKTQHARKVGKLWECCWGGIELVGMRSLALDYCMIWRSTVTTHITWVAFLTIDMAEQSHLKFSWRTEVGKCSSISQEVCQNCHPSRHNQPATCHTKLKVSKNDSAEDCSSCPTQYGVNGFTSLTIFDSCWHFVFIQRKHWSPADVDMGIRSCNFRTDSKNSGTRGPCNKEMDVFFTRWFLGMHWVWRMHRGRFISEARQVNQKPFNHCPNMKWSEFLSTKNCLMNWNPGRLMFLFIWSCSEESPMKDMFLLADSKFFWLQINHWINSFTVSTIGLDLHPGFWRYLDGSSRQWQWVDW